MSAMAMKLHKVIDTLDEMQLDALYKVAACFVAQRDFDYISPEDSERIKEGHEQILRGECVSFASAEEMAAHFGVNP
ncbi:MAG: hypothetical protein FWD25_01420 [Clostridia bacterium]|nr:hypothetical protein [Clostridia bacterium]